MNPVYDFIQKNRVLALIEKAQKTSARNLALDDFDLTCFPDVLVGCQGLYSLNLGHNKYNNLDRFPEALRNLTQLITLNISHNPMHELSSSIGCLVSLEILWCNSCLLTQIPDEIGNLWRLQTLGARHNKITSLPIRICELINLQWLTLEDNNLSSVPKYFDNLQMLRHINFNKNNFSTLPYKFSNLKNLKYLHLQNNEFFSLPERTIFAMPFTNINLQHNPLQLEDNKMFPNVVITGMEDEILDMFGYDSDSSSDDWDHSLDSTDLNYSATDEDSDNENREVMSLNDYEQVNILGSSNTSTIFKIRHKTSGQFYVWYVIDYETFSNHQLVNIEEKFLIRSEMHHPNLLEFHEVIKEKSCMYLLVKYCKQGSLKDLMCKITNENKRFSEEFLCKIIYQIAFTIKTINLLSNISIKDIYFDDDYNVKFFNFSMDPNEKKLKSPKISSLGGIIYEACMLTKFNKKTFEKDLKTCDIYKKDFLTFIQTMLKDNRYLKKNIDKIMCNATVLYKITQWNKHKCFLQINNDKHSEYTENTYAQQLENLKEKEILLQKKEALLKEKERKLTIKEKQLDELEKQFRDTLKRPKNCLCSDKIPKENLDSTYADSLIVPTSKKLNVKEIVKPPTFSRTLSEKRIRFKGHSPLKDFNYNFNSRRSLKCAKYRKAIQQNSDEEYKNNPYKLGKQLFVTCEKDMKVTSEDVKPLRWTEENKKYAFELLRLMNKENKSSEIKHTDL
ncbi:unnamed protein product [Phyllotreta striolata]|uniref:Protein kinase domain-containing protein n=1 Tax=Phyllotreta striolata TaxID=444603 RepID=A0A9N9TKY1_PHYSR|nr:unnamed protein product [Phyllotreta striolata]